MTSLYVAPHLDDIALSCAGAVLSRARAGRRVVACTVFTKSGDAAIDRARAAEETSRTVMQVERVQKLALDLETGLRGFVITGDEPFLGPYDSARQRFPAQAPYAVSLAYHVRFVMQLNAREAMHLIELRTTPQGHPAYRRVAQEMHRLIAEEAGHPAVAALMRHVDLATEPALGRLAAERRAEARRLSP